MAPALTSCERRDIQRYAVLNCYRAVSRSQREIEEGAMIAKDSRIQDRLEHSHHADDIARRLAEDPPVSYLRDWIYGGIDGTITTFAIVAGVVGADMPGSVVLVLGLANLIADGFAMGAGNYSATKAEVDDFNRLLAVEQRH